MSSLFALLSQQTPNLQTRKGLILLDLQNDFLPGGKLPVDNIELLDRIRELVPAFREFGDVIWVRSEFESTRPVNGLDTPGDTVIAGGFDGTDPEVPSSPETSADFRYNSSVPMKKRKASPQSSATYPQPDVGEDDEELFLSRTSSREPCCLRGSRGAEYSDLIKPLIQHKDLQVVKTHYSAFGATSLLLTLRSKLITDLYVCGNITNLSVYATAMDAARYGIQINIIDDCLGYRKQDRHDLALEQLQTIMSADVMSAKKALDDLRNPLDEEEHSEEEDDESKTSGQQQQGKVKDRAGSRDDDDELEVDSDESDGEVSLPTVRYSGPLDRRLELRYANRGSGHDSLLVADRRPRITPTDYAESSSIKRPVDRIQQHISRNFSGPRAEHNVKPKFEPASSLGNLDSRESSSYRQPWLDVIPRSASSGSSPSPKIPPSSRHPGLAALSATIGLDLRTVSEYEAMMQRARTEDRRATSEAMSKPLFGENMEEESAGSRISYDLLPPELADTMFDELKNEVDWQSMYHLAGEVPRLVCCQGTIGADGSMPVYRHPSDQTMPLQSWSPTVDRVRKAAEKVVGDSLNHVLIQLYRGGTDFISEHSDKTLDIARGSSIVNVSFGAQRTMRLRTKRGQGIGLARTTYRVPMPHNSMITMSLKSNAQYLHGINADKRPACELLDAEKAFGGQRISLTFRNIGTFLDKDSSTIWGQGASGKTKEEARPVINGHASESERMTRAFGAENAASSIEWVKIYGDGFDVLHLK